MIFLLALAGLQWPGVAWGQTAFGKHPADKILPGAFSGSNGVHNADTLVDGLNLHATRAFTNAALISGLGGGGGGVDAAAVAQIVTDASKAGTNDFDGGYVAATQAIVGRIGFTNKNEPGLMVQQLSPTERDAINEAPIGGGIILNTTDDRFEGGTVLDGWKPLAFLEDLPDVGAFVTAGDATNAAVTVSSDATNDLSAVVVARTSGVATNLSLYGTTTAEAITATSVAGEGSQLTDLQARNVYDDGAMVGDVLSEFMAWEAGEKIIWRDGVQDENNDYIHIVSLASLTNGWVAAYYGHWTNASLSGPNEGRIKAAYARSINELQTNKVGIILEPSDLTVSSSGPNPYTYISGPQVKKIDGVYWMTAFAGTNVSGVYEGQTSCGVLFYSHDGTNFVEAPSSPYAPFAYPTSGPDAHNQWDVGNVFVGSISKVDDLYYIHYIAYANSDFGNPASYRGNGMLHLASSPDPMTPGSWTRHIGQDILLNGDGTDHENVGGSGAYIRLRDGRWLLSGSQKMFVSTSPHPTNFYALPQGAGFGNPSITWDGGPDSVSYFWGYGMFRDAQGYFQMIDDFAHTATYTMRPRRSAEIVRGTSMSAQRLGSPVAIVGSLTVSNSVSLPDATIGLVNLDAGTISATINQITYNLTGGGSTESIYVANSGASDFDGLWRWKVSDGTYTNAALPGTAIYLDTTQWSPGASYLIVTNATNWDWENFDLVAYADLDLTGVGTWYDSSFSEISGILAYYADPNPVIPNFNGVYAGDGSALGSTNQYLETPIINAGTLTGSNYVATLSLGSLVVATNLFSGAVVDFSTSEGTITLSGNLTFTGISNFDATGYNAKIIHILPGGANRTIAPVASWRKTRGTHVVTNGTMASFLFEAQIGVFTNMSQIDYYQ